MKRISLLPIAAVAVAVIAPATNAEPIISEFMAANSRTLLDDDRETSDWIEIHNPDAAPVSLAGWHLTDHVAKKTKWTFPAVTVPPGGYLIVFASGKNRRDPGRALHTSFSLDADGEHLALIRPDGLTAVSEYSPTFPPQSPDVSYGRPATGSATGRAAFLQRPTPGARNAEADLAPAIKRVGFSRHSGPFAAPFALELTGAGANEHIRYELAAPSTEGASAIADPTRTSPRYDRPLWITHSTLIRAAIFSADGTRQGPVSARHHLLTAADSPDVGGFQTALPVVVLGLHGYGMLDSNRTPFPGWVHVYDAAPTTRLFTGTPATTSTAELRVRGNSSALFPKKGYNIELVDEGGGRRSEPLLGLTPSSSWALVSPWWYDRTYVHNALMYAVSNRIGRWAPRTRFVEVFYDGDGVLASPDYAGVSLLTERIEIGPGHLNLVALSPNDTAAPAITGGYLLKIDVPDGGDYSFITDHGLPDMDSAAVIVVSPNAEKLAPAQRDYIRGYVQQMENALFAGRDSGWRDRSYTDYIDVASWVDHHLLQTLSANLDSFYHSAYFHKNRGGKLAAGPVWDFDRALGSYDPRTQPPEGWDPGHTEMWESGWFGVLARDPEFQQAWVDRWQSLRASELASAALRARCDALAAEVTLEAAARDAARWPDNQSDTGAGFSGEMARLKDWISRRADWIDQQFVAPPTRVATDEAITFMAPDGAQLAYTTDGSDPRSLGGGVAPTARLTNRPLTVLAETNIHVRSYQPALVDVFPGSPWSSAVGGSKSTPLAPKSRLVNLSTRAIAGTDDDALLSGVVIADTSEKRMLGRAIGPGLAAFGATGVLAAPELTVLRADGAQLYRNQGWQAAAEAAQLPGIFQAVGAFPLAIGSADSAIAGRFQRGAYTLRATSAAGRPGLCLAELYELDANGRIANVAIRARVGEADAMLIAGFVTQGAAHQRLLIRAIGPSLGRFGLSTGLPDPVLTLHAGAGIIGSTAESAPASERADVARAAERVGAFPLSDDGSDAAILITVPPGAYTVQVKSRGGIEGHVLLEIYDVP